MKATRKALAAGVAATVAVGLLIAGPVTGRGRSCGFHARGGQSWYTGCGGVPQEIRVRYRFQPNGHLCVGPEETRHLGWTGNVVGARPVAAC
ncbi:DUF6355 family natural product biosynthesis protein [Spirillospora sp. CA-253888]